MRVSMHHIDREFSPSEAAAITGVSVDLQRDWRRRGLLPENKEGKWTRFDLTHIIRMCVKKAFSEAGFSVSSVTDCADMAVLPTLALIKDLPGAVVFEGEEISDQLKALTLGRSVVGAHGRYLVMVKGANGTSYTSRWNDLDGLDEFMAEQKAVHCTVLALSQLAESIAQRAGLPLQRIEVERVPIDE